MTNRVNNSISDLCKVKQTTFSGSSKDAVHVFDPQSRGTCPAMHKRFSILAFQREFS